MILAPHVFMYFYGVHNHNEFNTNNFTPLSLCRDRPRALTNHEQADYDRMIANGPKIHAGPIPFEGAHFPTVIDSVQDFHLRVPFVKVQHDTGRWEVYALGLKFNSTKQAKEFIQDYVVQSMKPTVRALLTGNHNKLARRMRAHKVCLKGALEEYYNGRAVHGTTILALRRRGLIQKLVV